MALAADLTAAYDNFKRTAPGPVFKTIDSANRAFIASFDPQKTIHTGQPLPAFQLPSATGQEISSGSLLARGPLLISFYRGGWCPFCNIELRALQKHLPKFHAAGVELVAISPELPDQSLSRTQKMGLEFLVLSDVGNKLARGMGLIHPQPESMRPLLEELGSDWKTRESMEVPVPATLLVDQKGIVRETFINPNYQKRLEPTTALKWIEELKKS